MKKKIVIFDLVSKEYFQGVNPKPEFGDDVTCANKYDTEADALNRLNEEVSLWGQDIFEGKVFVFINIVIL